MMMRQICVPTDRTVVIEFMRAPFGGVWLDGAQWLTAQEIAVGTGLTLQRVRRVLRAVKTFHAHPGTQTVYRLWQ